MTRENYIAFKKTLLDSGYVWDVIERDNYIKIEPNQNIPFPSANILVTICDKIGIDYEMDEKYTNYETGENGYHIIRTKYGALDYIYAKHFGTQAYYARYRIVGGLNNYN